MQVGDLLSQLKARREQVIELVHSGEGDPAEEIEQLEAVAGGGSADQEIIDAHGYIRAILGLSGHTLTVGSLAWQESLPAKERCVFSFVMMSVACMENCGHVEVVVTRSGLLHFPASIAFRTKDGTATSHEDFVPIEGRLSFQADEVEKSFQVEIVDDDRAEDQEEFTCELYDPQVDGNALCQGALGDVPVTTIKIIDKDIPGILAFDHENDSLDVKANVDSDVTVEALIKRMEGASGLVSCKYRTEAATAQAGEDFEPVEGTLEFLHGECEKKIELTIKGRKRYEATQMHGSRAAFGFCVDMLAEA
eukprot:s380_g15.t1